MVQIICAFLSAASAIAVAVIGFNVKKNEKRDQEQRNLEEQQQEIRRKESRLSLQLLDASIQLGIVCANALSGGHNNGNVEEARIAANKAREEYVKFLMETMANERV